jgi:glycosyltransferase involved in cell wall biosynthesis
MSRAAHPRGTNIRILFVTSWFSPQSVGGTELHLRELALALRAEHEVSVFTQHRDPDDREYAVRRLEVEGLPVHSVVHNFSDTDHFFRLYANPAIERVFDEHLAREAPDVCHVHHLTCLSTTMLEALRRRGVPTVMTLHDSWLLCPRGQRLHPSGDHCATIDRERCIDCMRVTWPHLFPPAGPGAPAGTDRETVREMDRHVRRVLAFPDLLIAPSEFHRREFVAWGVPSERIRAIPHGLPRVPVPVPVARRAPDGRFRIGYLGTLIPSKGVHVLVEAFRRLERPDATLELHGEWFPYHQDAGYLERLRELAAGDPGIAFHGRYGPAELPAILAELDVLVVPSIWFETFSLTVREGWLARLPVVASDHGALREALGEGRRGRLFPPGDAAALASVLRELHDNPVARDTIRGRPEWVRTVDDMVRELKGVYHEVAARPRPAAAAAGWPDLDRFHPELRLLRGHPQERRSARLREGFENLGRAFPGGGAAAPYEALARQGSALRRWAAVRGEELLALEEERSRLRQEARALEARGARSEADQEELRRRVAALEEEARARERELREVEADRRSTRQRLDAVSSSWLHRWVERLVGGKRLGPRP